jgi:hypothetical protein
MSVTDLEVIDVISIDPNGNAVLTISDHLIWDEKNEHLMVLQNKINSYLGFIESGNVYEEYPNAKDRNIVIQIVAKYEPNNNNNAMIFLERVEETLRSAGYGFDFSVAKIE